MEKAMTSLTADLLREIVRYDKDTGKFTWLANRGTRARAGHEAGSLSNGYVTIKLQGKVHKAHRLAWLYMTGAWPVMSIDHIDGDKANNKFSNLRDVSRSANLQNQIRPQAGNRAGALGVTPHRSGFQARIQTGKTQKYLGTFQTAEQAHAAYLDAKRTIHIGSTI
jgi:hypothetical protein